MRITPKERQNLLDWCDEEGFASFSDYLRTAMTGYHHLRELLGRLQTTLQQRALTTFECNVYAVVDPEMYAEHGGAQLTKPPHERCFR